MSATTTSSLKQLKPHFRSSTAVSSRRIRWTAVLLLVLFILLKYKYFHRLPGIPSLGFTQSHGPTTEVATPSVDHSSVDWSRFAYVQYVTNSVYLCNSVMIFETLYRLGSKADRVMMYPRSMADPAAKTGQTEEEKLLIKARDQYGVKLVPIQVQHRDVDNKIWEDSFTKLLAFNQTQYSRVLSLDSDSTVLQPMDELFLLPPCPVAMPRAYWLYPDNKILSSQIMLVEPSRFEFERVMQKTGEGTGDDYDMEIVNYLYRDHAMVLPHRTYDILSAEFRGVDHQNYLGSAQEKWDPVAAFNEAKFLHFSDHPVPKPWDVMSDSIRAEMQPGCSMRNGVEDCTERVIWNGLYTDFFKRRQEVCNINRRRSRRP